MSFQGISLEGISCVGLNPLEFSGLAGWWRSDTGITLAAGSGVKSWNDLSGNNRHLTAINRSTLAQVAAAGNLINTSNGLAFSNDNGVLGLSCITDYLFKKMLYDGRPMTAIVVFKIITLLSNTGYRFLASGTQPSSSRGYFQHGAPTNNYPVRTLNSAGVTIGNNDMINVFSAPGGHVSSVIDLGYSASSSNLHRRAYIDGVEKTKIKFSAAPSASDDLINPFSIQSGPANALYEIILYDHSDLGKSSQRILDEHNALFQNYIIPSYPNLFL